MTTHSETRAMPYSAQQMFDLVADVERYPEFLPWCAGARVRGVEERGDHREMTADLVISFKVFRETFGSRVRLFDEEKRIETEYLEGPFRKNESTWRFKDTETGCNVHFTVEFEFRNFVLQKAAGLFFYEAMQRIVRAFEDRAHRLYGATGPA